MEKSVRQNDLFGNSKHTNRLFFCKISDNCSLFRYISTNTNNSWAWTRSAKVHCYLFFTTDLHPKKKCFNSTFSYTPLPPVPKTFPSPRTSGPIWVLGCDEENIYIKVEYSFDLIWWRWMVVTRAVPFPFPPEKTGMAKCCVVVFVFRGKVNFLFGSITMVAWFLAKINHLLEIYEVEIVFQFKYNGNRLFSNNFKWRLRQKSTTPPINKAHNAAMCRRASRALCGLCSSLVLFGMKFDPLIMHTNFVPKLLWEEVGRIILRLETTAGSWDQQRTNLQRSTVSPAQ